MARYPALMDARISTPVRLGTKSDIPFRLVQPTGVCTFCVLRGFLTFCNGNDFPMPSLQFSGASMLITHLGKWPVLDPSAYVAPNATICGDVTIGAGCRIMFGACVVSKEHPSALVKTAS